MSDSFLNLTGLRYYHDKILALFATKTEVGNKVDKVSGKGLSTNDYTTTEKNKLSGIATGAQVNVIESIKVNGTAQTITSKAVDISVPTKLSDLTNDGNFVTDASYVHTDNNYTTTEKNKLSGIASGAEVNQNAFSNIKVGSTTVAADSKTDTVEFVGSGVTITPDATNDKITFTVAAQTIDSALSSTSTNPVQNKVIYSALGEKITMPSGGVATQVLAKTENGVEWTDKAGQVYLLEHNIENGTRVIRLNRYLASEDNPEQAGIIQVVGNVSENNNQPVQSGAVYTALQSKANTASPSFTGSPTAPTAAAGTNTTQIATTQFVTTAVANAIAGVTSISYQVVTTLPSTGENGVIYLVTHSHGTGDGYDEYIWVGSSFEKLGNTDIDLSGYMLKTDMVAITTAEIDTLFA